MKTDNKPDTNWPFPSYPAKEWTKKQVKDYEDQQRKQTPDAPMCLGIV